MPFWDAIVLIVLIGAVVRIFQMRHAAAATRTEEPTSDLSRDEVRQLKERIQVLERVITDNHGSRDLESEIERLRDR